MCAPGLRTGLIEPPWVRGEIPGASSGLGFPCRQMGRCLAAFSQTGREPPGRAGGCHAPLLKTPRAVLTQQGPTPRSPWGSVRPCGGMSQNIQKVPPGREAWSWLPARLPQSSCHHGCTSAGPSACLGPSKAGRRGWKQTLCSPGTQPILWVRAEGWRARLTLCDPGQAPALSVPLRSGTVIPSWGWCCMWTL